MLNDILQLDLASLIYESWYRGNCINLDGVGYGSAHWDDDTHIDTEPLEYYYLLAGIINITQANRILEIGTHQGGSTMSICRGLTDQETGRILTLDTTNFGKTEFSGHPIIRAHQSNANTQAAYEICKAEFGDKIDILFIDSCHEFWTTYLHVQIYVSALNPTLMLIDDITLNEEMRQLWDIIVKRYGDNNCANASFIIPNFRPIAGFGIVRFET